MKKNIRYRTDYLLPKNNFLVGMGSILNIAGSYFEYNYSKSDNEADLKSLTSDWDNVGQDIRKSKISFEEENKHKLCLK
ncbi:hypothetical protein JoomaDRAFT_1508 [Galbibacter orientalis DSM 19592]|uniref:Uncharacterized protein n=1 Tax=Galbibacter orientalis DSM 19592 TaxID=926559 RepID=I3C4I0_9FLAO|nr:hypothetical protein [Galbibacter orientalis]EIJ38523.1 hypothetical protein JoomaDRAFT_1508 [Galbibacter orientalis DSM 19592]